MDPGQDLLLAALSESGICPNDLFDVDPQDTLPLPASQQSVSLNALDIGLRNEASGVVRVEPAVPPTPTVTIREKPQPSTTTFVLNQLNQLPSLGTIVVTKPSAGTTARQTIRVTKVVHTSSTAQRSSLSSPAVCTVVPPNNEQIRLKDLLRTSSLKTSSLGELMKLKPPPDIARPVATATATGTTELNNGLKKEVSSKDVARIWVNDDMKMRSFSPVNKLPGMKEEEEPEEEEEEELGHAETYAEYMPMKLRIGLRHPDPVVETSSLSSVNPPDVWYRLSIPEEIIDRGWLSALQLEAITYAAQQHETFLPNGDRAAYLIGDGAGVGKGRTIAGIIYENYLLGRKRSLWFSVSNDLKYDAERDLRDIGAKNIQVYSLNKFKYGKISSKHNGSVKKGVIFATYSSLIGESQSGGKYKTRFKQLLHWCGDDFDGVIIFDECHKAKNVCPIGSSKPTKTGLAVLELQNKLPKARVVYASATGASEPRNMAYMNRLGIWGEGTPFKEFTNFIQAVERRGVGAMEIVAMDMKLRGMYIARQLSFTGVTFKIEEVPLTLDYIKMYNKSVRLWVRAREKFQQAANLMDAEQRMKKSMWGQFWSAHQRFFKYLCIASKVRRVVQLAREEVKNGKCVVIGLQSTGEARTLEALEEGGGELNDFVSTAKGVLQSLVEKHFPAPDRQKLFSLLGIDLSVKETPSPSETSTEQKGKKRRGPETKKQVKKARKSGGLSGTSSDESNSDDSDKDVESDDSFNSVSSGEEDEDDFNPFKDDSSEDEEDDPWLIRKDTKKSKDKRNKKKKKKKSIDPDSIQSALLASGLGTTRPTFTTPTIKPSNNTVAVAKSEPEESSCVTSQDAVEDAQRMKRDLLEQLEQLAENLPPNTLDELIDELGGPDIVAEMTGRKGRVVSNDDGTISYESRSELDVPVEILNLTEKQRFMDGDKNIAIISEAASSGISLQADRRVKNQRRRVHMTLELPWSADRAIQQFGRTHRSNQVTAPEYVFLISELAGEQRFASIVAKRLESLGALTHGDRRATETRDLSRFNFDNKYGRNALEIVMKSIVSLDSPLVSPPADFDGDFFKEIRNGLIGVGLINVEDRSGVLLLEKDYNNIGKFLNRILGMEVHQQNALFQYFSDTLNAVIQVKKVDVKKFLTPGYSTSGHVELYTVSVERGMSWEDATHVWADQNGPDDGFYVQVRNNKKISILVKEVNPRKRLFMVYRPNIGKQVKLETYADIKKRSKKVLSDDAKQHWIDQYNSSANVCSHAYWRGNCKKVSVGLQCEIGLRCRMYYVLCGSVLSVWTKVEGVLASVSGANVKIQIVRLRTEDGQRIVGLIIPANCVSPLINILSSSDQSQQLAVQQQQMWQQLHPQSISHTVNT
ncbi:LOW QUALITY PROTEIN: protein strawberry notch homolog 1-like [Sinocyclocheilus rhinocerous]|uniref:LOW QUALITY PROTEIN: protein strawberry notch homolog 1-like n=1 Tax=Sinocyclocheilus rhinocerous TaxID=307959 RepID=UPI0007B7C560|nr:PREDICTED: LOW QUALITY PROTEIN: protein strawberry notch homolog 1-like [Sinocyclocheilus rhinocerous]